MRKLNEDYNTPLWTYLLGTADGLPKNILNSEEQRVLKAMVSHRYLNGGTRKLGVVRTHDGETIAMGNLIRGICAGLHRDRRLSLAKWVSGAKSIVDNLFTATLSYDLSLTGLAKKNGDQNEQFGPSGTWTTAQCPAKYNRNNNDEVTQATDAEILGDIDGFILGYALPGWEKRGVRLSQLLRMYYGSGVVYDETYRSCNRKSKFRELVDQEEISDEIEAFAYAYYLKNSGKYGNVKKSDIRGIALDTTEEFEKYFGKQRFLCIFNFFFISLSSSTHTKISIRGG